MEEVVAEGDLYGVSDVSVGKIGDAVVYYHTVVCAGFTAEGERFFGDAFVDDAMREHGLTELILGHKNMEIGKSAYLVIPKMKVRKEV